MKLQSLFQPLLEDFRTVIREYSLDLDKMDHGHGLKAMHYILNIISNNRAYDDSHPAFVSKYWRRVLPYDGRPHCFFYIDGADDSHLATLLKKIKSELMK